MVEANVTYALQFKMLLSYKESHGTQQEIDQAVCLDQNPRKQAHAEKAINIVTLPHNRTNKSPSKLSNKSLKSKHKNVAEIQLEGVHQGAKEGDLLNVESDVLVVVLADAEQDSIAPGRTSP